MLSIFVILTLMKDEEKGQMTMVNKYNLCSSMFYLATKQPSHAAKFSEP